MYVTTLPHVRSDRVSFFVLIRSPPSSTPFPTRRSSDLHFPFLMEPLLLSESGVRWHGYCTMTLPVIFGWMERSEEHTSELQSLRHLVCRLLLEKKND